MNPSSLDTPLYFLRTRLVLMPQPFSLFFFFFGFVQTMLSIYWKGMEKAFERKWKANILWRSSSWLQEWWSRKCTYMMFFTHPLRACSMALPPFMRILHHLVQSPQLKGRIYLWLLLKLFNKNLWLLIINHRFWVCLNTLHTILCIGSFSGWLWGHTLVIVFTKRWYHFEGTVLN